MHRTLVITSPPASLRLTTLAAIQAELGLSDPAQDERIEALIDQASAVIVDLVGRDLARASVTETVTLDCGDPTPAVIALARTPVASVASVLEGDDVIDLAGLDLDPARGLLYRRWGADRVTAWPEPRRIRIGYDGGYVLPGMYGRTLPASLERACVDTVLALWYRAGRGDPMIRSESVEGIGSTSYLDPAAGVAGAVPPAAMAVLSTYRRARL